MRSRNGWNRNQLLVALHLYCKMPFGKMHKGNPEIVRFSKMIGRTPSALAMKLTNIASLDPAIISSGRKGLPGASAADSAMWNEMQSNWESFALEAADAVHQLESSQEIADSSTQDQAEDQGSYIGIDKITQTKVRVGQSFFRQAVLSAYDFRCCITGLNVPELLIASHIVPWRVDVNNRMNPKNGLCLSTLHDRAFDIGLIAVDSSMKIMVSPKIKKINNDFFRDAVLKYEGASLKMPEKFLPEQNFLKYHREVLFKSSV